VPFSLKDLALTQWMEGELQKVNKEDLLEVSPGDEVPDGAEVAGVMSDALKALWCILYRLDGECTQMHDDLLPEYEGEVVDREVLREKVAHFTPEENVRWNEYLVLQYRVCSLQQYIWAAMRTEFKLEHFTHVDYGPLFEVYGHNPIQEVGFDNESELEEPNEDDLVTVGVETPLILH
jgi:hypothetical protein